MALFILAMLLLGAVWGATWHFQLPPKIALVTTGATLFLLLVVALVRRLRARSKKKKAEQPPEKPPAVSAEPPRGARSELRPELQAMQAEFSRAVLALKTSKLSRGGRDAISVLPWYLVIGSPESGKSTALRNSGLKFPYLTNRGGGGGRSVGPTRHCDWWLTNEAVFLDAAGRYVTGDEDREEWLSFLDVLGKHRPHRPLNGLIVTVSVSELMGADPQAAGELGQRLRERIDELTSRLRTVVPIYVMITKCDLLTGFVETFSDLPRSERGQIWGFTVPLMAQPEAPTELLLKRFDEMTSIVEQRSVRRIGQERRLEARERIYQFPQRFDSIRKNLSEFIQPLFLENVFQDTPVMRGVYFTSGAQELRATEARQPTASGDSLLAASRSTAEPATEGRSFFIWDVFTKIMFQDQKLAVRSSMEEIRQRRRRYTLAGACLALTVVLLVLPTLSFFNNRRMLHEVRDTLLAVKPHATDDISSQGDISRIQDLSPLQKHLAELHRHRAEGVPVWMRMGLYQGDQLFLLAQTFYNNRLKGLLLGRQHDRIKQSLEGVSVDPDQANRKHSTESYGRHFDDLKMYLLITSPRTRREPLLDESHQRWLVGQMTRHWENILRNNGQVKLMELITEHANTYIAMLATDPDQLAFPRDDQVLRVARRVLNEVPLTTLELERIVAQANNDYPGVSLGESVGTVPFMHATKRVGGAFTRRAWEESIRTRMDKAFQDSEAWVLDRDAEEDEETNRRDLRTSYYQRYILEWESFLHSIKVDEPKNWDQSEALLESLTRGKPPPIGKLFRTLAYNVQLELPKSTPSRMLGSLSNPFSKPDSAPPPPAQLIDRRSSTGQTEMTPGDVAKRFSTLLEFSTKASATPDGEEKLTQLDSYQDQLELVMGTLREVRDKPSEAGVFLEKIASTRNEVEMLIKSQETDHALFNQLLLPPLNQIKGVVSRGVSEKKSLKWCEEIFRPFTSLMANRYPFNKDALMDAPLPELTQFIHPSLGAVRKFVQSQLAGEVLPDGRRWEFAVKSAKGQGMYKEELLTYLERVNALATTLFPGDTADPLVRFNVRMRPGASADTSPSDIASITLTLDGSEEIYRNGPDNRWRPLIWPGPAGKLGAHLHVVGTAGNSADLDAPGEWGLFRLLERAKTIEPSTDGRFFTATWELGDLNNAQVSIDIRPERLANPFFGTSGTNTSQLFEIFRDKQLIPPAGIAQAMQSCPPPIVTAKTSP
ncbi:type VI secretion system membrane subunit TssM [Hyalangium sp.]|uniref:type VI secretion system membrane subunit TssM n=1 Tax=Hyalangium sp. TaxID=2028555 RepID=UPI002D4B12DC|nr:type VI secretion system membrane subunit TssM [Hyalangium sp.]HYI03174.1 type VI secretion system membrane subunit TssM [Hyalangium sp.]